MTNISHDLSNKLPLQIVEIPQIISKIADDLEIPILLVGATARDFILVHAHNLRATRATDDFDFGVAVSNWSDYENLKNKLVESKYFSSVEKVEHRLLENSTKTLIDLVPFGEIESPIGEIIWQNNHKMTTHGFTEAFENALNVKLSDSLAIKIVSPVGLAMLKLVAWQDRKSNKDSQDFWLIVKNYLDLGNYDRIFVEMDELLEADDFDYVVAGARLLGRDIAKIMKPRTKEVISTIFENEKILGKLALEIHRREDRFEENLDKFISSLESFWLGVTES